VVLCIITLLIISVIWEMHKILWDKCIYLNWVDMKVLTLNQKKKSF